MKLYLDCEFNSFKGELISMALVDERGDYFYEALPCVDPAQWVALHVMPILNTAPIEMDEFQKRLSWFLNKYDSIHVISDWPEDIKHFCDALITGPGVRLNTPPLTMEVLRIDAGSVLPHNALADASGIRSFLEKASK